MVVRGIRLLLSKDKNVRYYNIFCRFLNVFHTSNLAVTFGVDKVSIDAMSWSKDLSIYISKLISFWESKVEKNTLKFAICESWLAT